MPVSSSVSSSAAPVCCPRCGELNAPRADMCVICRVPLSGAAPMTAQNAAPVAAPQNNAAFSQSSNGQGLRQAPLASRLKPKPALLWSAAALICVLLLAAWRINQALQAPGVKAIITGDLTTTPSSPGTTAVAATSLLDKALVVAVAKNNVEEVRRLLQQGANPDAGTKSGVPVLVSAARLGNVPIAQMLVEKGCNVNLKMSDVSPRGKLVGGHTALHFAAMKGNDEVIKYLLSKGADVRMKTVDGFTPLLLASQKGTSGAVRLLIEGGSDMNDKTNDGFTPLIVAAMLGKTEVVRLLLEKGADINLKGPLGGSALAYAEKANHPDTAQVLRDAGAR